VEALGVELAINYRAEDFVEAVRKWKSGGVEVGFDNVGGDVTLRTYTAMAPYGRVVTLMGVAGDDSSSTAYNANLTIHAVMMLTPMWQGLRDRLASQADIVRQTLQLVAENRLCVRVARVIPISNASEAHMVSEAGGFSGKIVLEV
jgi:NADPH2:quinone reductase